MVPTLPRGPHKLSPGDVAASQRARMIDAVIEAVAEKGYVHTSVADVLSRAKVSRLTFYQQFRDKEDCFVAAFAQRATLLATVLTAVLDGRSESAGEEGSPIERVDRILATYLEALRASPATAKALLVEVYAAGERALQQRARSMEQFVDVVASAFAGSGGIVRSAPDQRFALQFLVGGVSSLVTNSIGAGETERLPELRQPLIDILRRLS